MKSQDITILTVGQPFNLFVGKDMTNEDSCVLEVLDGGGFAYMIYLNSMKEVEREALRKAKISVKIIKETDSFVLTLFRFGNTPLVFEAVFDLTIYKNEKRNDYLKSNLLTVIGIESSTNKIQTLRVVSVNNKLLQTWVKSWEQAKLIPNHNERYTKWIDDLYKRYNVLELWDMAIYVGKMGE